MEGTIVAEKDKTEREKNYIGVLKDKMLDRVKKLTNQVLDEIVKRVKNGEYGIFKYDEHTIYIEFDDYESETSWSNPDIIQFWIANGESHFDFYCEELYVPTERRPELYKFFKDIKAANSLAITYDEYLARVKNEDLQKELERLDEIEKAKALLRKHGETLF